MTKTLTLNSNYYMYRYSFIVLAYFFSLANLLTFQIKNYYLESTYI